MPSVPLVKFNSFVERLGLADHNFATDTIKVALTNTAPPATANVLADIVEIAAAGGYVAGGYTLTGVAWSQAAGTAKLVADDLNISAVGADIGPFRWLVVYNATAAGGRLIGSYDNGAAVTLTAGSAAFPLDLPQPSGIFTVT